MFGVEQAATGWAALAGLLSTPALLADLEAGSDDIPAEFGRKSGIRQIGKVCIERLQCPGDTLAVGVTEGASQLLREQRERTSARLDV